MFLQEDEGISVWSSTAASTFYAYGASRKCDVLLLGHGNVCLTEVVRVFPCLLLLSDPNVLSSYITKRHIVRATTTCLVEQQQDRCTTLENK